MILRLLLILIILFTNSKQALSAPDIKEITSKNGINAWLIHDNSLPIIAIKIAFKNAGSAYDGGTGTAYILSEMLDEGAGKLNDLQFKKQLEEYAIGLGFSVDKDNFYITLKTLSEHKEKAFEMLGLALTQPQFDPEALQRTQDQTMAFIAKNMESPGYIASLEWNKRVFGNHPYSRPSKGTLETVPKITVDDLQMFFRTRLITANMVISAVGDITEQELSQMIDTKLSPIPKKLPVGIRMRSLLNFNKFPEKSTFKIKKPIPQSVAFFGFEGIAYHDPNFYPAYILNYILGGGGFESRLMQEIREKRGLAYSVYTYMNNLSHVKLMQGSVGTKNESIAESIALINEQINLMHDEGITAEELAAAKNYLMGSFPLRMDSNQKLANMLSFIQIENLGIDFLEKRNDYVRAVTLKDVNRAAKKLMNTDKLVTVIVGGE